MNRRADDAGVVAEPGLDDLDRARRRGQRLPARARWAATSKR